MNLKLVVLFVERLNSLLQLFLGHVHDFIPQLVDHPSAFLSDHLAALVSCYEVLHSLIYQFKGLGLGDLGLIDWFLAFLLEVEVVKPYISGFLGLVLVSERTNVGLRAWLLLSLSRRKAIVRAFNLRWFCLLVPSRRVLKLNLLGRSLDTFSIVFRRLFFLNPFYLSDENRLGRRLRVRTVNYGRSRRCSISLLNNCKRLWTRNCGDLRDH